MIYLDPGHGGKDNGAEVKVIQEKTINLQVCKQIESYFLQQNVEYRTSRNRDYPVSLKKRVNEANDMQARLFVSVHSNFFKEENVSGYEIHHYPSSHYGRELAKSVHGCLSKQDFLDPRPIKRSGHLYVLKKTEMPAVLIELGFLSNDDDRKVLNDLNKTNLIAERIVEGITWYNGGRKP